MSFEHSETSHAVFYFPPNKK